MEVNNKKEIDDLPFDIWFIIFKKFTIADLCNCRLVNKKFKYFSDNYNDIYKLLIGDFHGDFYGDSCLDYKEFSIEEEDKINLFFFIKIKSVFNFNKNLKYLWINDYRLKLDEISNLINLEYLVIEKIAIHCDQFIDLKNLKTLIIKYPTFELNLKTPKLEKILIKKLNKNINFQSNPESVKHLITDNYDNKFEIFKNLEIIEIEWIENNLANNLLNFHNLKMLKFYNNGTRKSETELINQLIGNANLNKKIDFYYKGVKIKNQTKNSRHENIEIDLNFKFMNYADLDFQFINYDDLDFNLRCFKLNYRYFETIFNEMIKYGLPSNFFQKYSNISEVFVDGTIMNANNLNLFLNKLNNLYFLNLYKTSFDQEFFNNLPNTIRKLYIKNTYLNINYNFVLKLIRLNQFLTTDDQDLFDLAYLAFTKLKNLRNFQFKLFQNFIHVSKGVHGSSKLIVQSEFIFSNKKLTLISLI